LDEQIVKLDEQQLKIVRAQVALGLMLPLRIEIVQAQLEAARKAQESARQSFRSYLTQLGALTGRGSDYNFELDHTKPPLPPLPSLPEFLNQVMPVHPALRVQQAKVEVARQQVRVEQSNLLPTANLNTSFAAGQDLDYFNGNNRHRRPTEFLSYITIDIPLWDFGERRAATRESEEKLLYEKDSTDQLDLDIRSAITGAYGKIDDYAKNAAMAQSIYVRDQQALALARAQRREGLIDELTLTIAEVADRTAAVSLEAETNLERLEYAGLQNLGGGTWQWLK
jgi:outer membrane protein TolC